MYENFNYKNRIGLFPCLRNFPESITNYHIVPFSTAYKSIEEHVKKEGTKGLLVSSPSPINTGSLLIPIAVMTGMTYINLIDMVDREDSFDAILKNKELIVDEVGSENPKLRWMFDKLVHERYSKGLKTYFGSMYTLKTLSSIYKLPTVSKVSALVELSILVPKMEVLVTSMNTTNAISIIRS